MTATINTFIVAAASLLLLSACQSSDKKRGDSEKKTARLHVEPNQRVTCDTLDASFYLPGMFAFSTTDTYCVNRAKYFVYNFRHTIDTGIDLKITCIDEPGKYQSQAGLGQELDHIFAAYPDKKNNYGYMDTINQFPFVRLRESSPKKSWEANTVFSWVMSKYFSLRITNRSFYKCDTACYQRMVDSVMASIVFSKAAIDAPAQAPPDTPAAK